MHKSKWAPQQSTPPPTDTTTPSVPPQSLDDSRPDSNSSLSAAAPSFEPVAADPAARDGAFDAFAQTAQEDDLFDEVVPVEESMQTRPPDDLFEDDFTPVPQPVVEQTGTELGRGRGRGGGGMRGRGRGRGGRGGGREAQRTVSSSEQRKAEETKADPPENAPTGPRNKGITPADSPNRHNTGGVRKPKLSEAELAAKMAAISLKNASLTAAHARAEADAASFAEREEQAKKDAAHARREAEHRKREERKDRQQMMGERERNRMRKLKAMEGREWDMEKQEQDFEKGGRFDKPGGFTGEKTEQTDGREYLYRERRGGGGNARGGRGGKQDQPQHAPRKEDFPDLPPASRPAAEAKKATSLPVDKPDVSSPGAGKSWADQVESSTTS